MKRNNEKKLLSVFAAVSMLASNAVCVNAEEAAFMTVYKDTFSVATDAVAAADTAINANWKAVNYDSNLGQSYCITEDGKLKITATALSYGGPQHADVISTNAALSGLSAGDTVSFEMIRPGNNGQWGVLRTIYSRFNYSQDGDDYYEIGITGGEDCGYMVTLPQDSGNGIPSTSKASGTDFAFRPYFMKVENGAVTYIDWDDLGNGGLMDFEKKTAWASNVSFGRYAQTFFAPTYVSLSLTNNGAEYTMWQDNASTGYERGNTWIWNGTYESDADVPVSNTALRFGITGSNAADILYVDNVEATTKLASKMEFVDLFKDEFSTDVAVVAGAGTAIGSNWKILNQGGVSTVNQFSVADGQLRIYQNRSDGGGNPSVVSTATELNDINIGDTIKVDLGFETSNNAYGVVGERVGAYARVYLTADESTYYEFGYSDTDGKVSGENTAPAEFLPYLRLVENGIQTSIDYDEDNENGIIKKGLNLPARLDAYSALKTFTFTLTEDGAVCTAAGSDWTFDAACESTTQIAPDSTKISFGVYGGELNERDSGTMLVDNVILSGLSKVPVDSIVAKETYIDADSVSVYAYPELTGTTTGSVLAIVGFYTESGQLSECKFAQINSEGQFDVTKTDKAYDHIKVFAWDGWSNIVPLHTPFEF